jgi:hypothetical protein
LLTCFLVPVSTGARLSRSPAPSFPLLLLPYPRPITDAEITDAETETGADADAETETEAEAVCGCRLPIAEAEIDNREGPSDPLPLQAPGGEGEGGVVDANRDRSRRTVLRFQRVPFEARSEPRPSIVPSKVRGLAAAAADALYSAEAVHLESEVGSTSSKR